MKTHTKVETDSEKLLVEIEKNDFFKSEIKYTAEKKRIEKNLEELNSNFKRVDLKTTL